MEHEKPKLPTWVPMVIILAVLVVIGCGGLAMVGLFAFRTVDSIDGAMESQLMDLEAAPETSVEQVPEESPAKTPAPSEPSPEP